MKNKSLIADTLNFDGSKTYLWNGLLNLINISTVVPVFSADLDAAYYYKLIFKTSYLGFTVGDPVEYNSVVLCDLIKYSSVYLIVTDNLNNYVDSQVPIDKFSSKDYNTVIDGNVGGFSISITGIVRGDDDTLGTVNTLRMLLGVMLIAYPKSHYDLQNTASSGL